MNQVTAEQRADFFVRLSAKQTEGLSLGAACASIGLGHSTPYLWAKEYPEWRALVESFRKVRRTIYGVDYLPGTKRAMGGAV